MNVQKQRSVRLGKKYKLRSSPWGCSAHTSIFYERYTVTGHSSSLKGKDELKLKKNFAKTDTFRV